MCVRVFVCLRNALDIECHSNFSSTLLYGSYESLDSVGDQYLIAFRCCIAIEFTPRIIDSRAVFVPERACDSVGERKDMSAKREVKKETQDGDESSKEIRVISREK
jgi:hypothetical protein